MNSQQEKQKKSLLRDRIVFISGSGSPLGNNIAIELARNGAQLILTDRNSKALDNLAKNIQIGFKSTTHILPFNPARTDPVAYGNLAQKIRKRVPYLDAVILTNHWFDYEVNLISYPFSLWQTVIQLNLTSSFMLSQSLIPLLLRARNPQLVFNIYNNNKKKGHKGYKVAQNGLESLMKAWAEEFSRSHLTVFAIQSAITTNSSPSLENKDLQKVASMYPGLLAQEKPSHHGQTIHRFNQQPLD